ncbi:hypothetical protein [Mycobacterium avium]|nr:hypothetical protein [Mycobacterium avium]
MALDDQRGITAQRRMYRYPNLTAHEMSVRRSTISVCPEHWAHHRPGLLARSPNPRRDAMTITHQHPGPSRAPVRRDGNRHWYDFADARPFVDPATGNAPHYIEASVAVYLRVSDDRQRWIVDGATVDGTALDFYTDPHASNCPCSNPDACESAVIASEGLPVPNGRELLDLLAAAHALAEVERA